MLLLSKLLSESVLQRKPTADGSSCGGGKRERGGIVTLQAGREGWCLLQVLESVSLSPPIPPTGRRREGWDEIQEELTPQEDTHDLPHIPLLGTHACAHTHSLAGLSLSIPLSQDITPLLSGPAKAGVISGMSNPLLEDKSSSAIVRRL